MKLTLTFYTQYNGIDITPTDDAVVITDAMQEVFDEVSDTLSSMTYEMADKFDLEDLPAKPVGQLIYAAQQIIRKLFSCADNDVEFKFDHTST